MKKTLIIAEKPEQMLHYANALGFRKNGDIYEKDHYIMVSAWGHLLELAKDTAYRLDEKWDKSYLPLLPALKDFIYEPKRDDEGRKKQLEKIGKVLNRDDISLIYVATDGDREGELIFRYIYNYFQCKIPFKRIWVKSLDDEVIRKAFANPLYVQGDSFLENLSKSAYSRVIADWLIGVNGTQSATLHFGRGSLLSIGRVQSTILKIICERYKKHKSHQKTYTYKILTLHSHNEIKYLAESPVYESKNEAESILKKLSENHRFVSFQRKKEMIKPPLLHTLDSLTIMANTLYKYDASQVLVSAQKLYENKLISYPRTEDPYITEEGYTKLKKHLLPLVQKCLNIDNFTFQTQLPESVNDTKITGSHDALIPTGQANFENLTQQDKIIYTLILRRCLESFSSGAIYEKGVYLFENNGIPFITRTHQVLEMGWKKYSPIKSKKESEDEENENSFVLELPYKQGDNVQIENQTIREIESKPPAIYTPATLIKDLSNLAKFLQQENPELYNKLKSEIDLKSLQIGTKGTRPEIIKQLVEKRKFVSFENNKYIPTELGLKFYETIKNMAVVNVEETAKFEYNLSKVAKGEMSEEEFYQEVTKYVRRIVDSVFEMQVNLQMHQQDSLGVCPKCKKGYVREGTKAWGCSEYKNGCNFTIWKEIASKKLTQKNIKDLINKGKTSLIKGFKSSAGKEYSAHIKLDDNFKTQFDYSS